MLIPDRLPSLVLLVGFWVPPAAIGWAAARYAFHSTTRGRVVLTHALLANLVLGWAAAWFLVQVDRMPPYIPGASADPTDAPPKAVVWLLVMTGALVLPASALACALAFRGRRRSLERTSTARASA